VRRASGLTKGAVGDYTITDPLTHLNGLTARSTATQRHKLQGWEPEVAPAKTPQKTISGRSFRYAQLRSSFRYAAENRASSDPPPVPPNCRPSLYLVDAEAGQYGAPNPTPGAAAKECTIQQHEADKERMITATKGAGLSTRWYRVAPAGAVLPPTAAAVIAATKKEQHDQKND
jgi:hypothetical protein